MALCFSGFSSARDNRHAVNFMIKKKHFKYFFKKACFLLMVIALTLEPVFGSSTGITSAEFTAINPDPKSSAMGGGVLADSFSISSLLVNPASTADFFQMGFSFSDSRLAQDLNYQFGGIIIPTKIGNFGAAASLLSYGNIQGTADLTYSNYDIAGSQDQLFVLNYSLPFKKSVPVKQAFGAIGANVKFINSTLAGYSASAYSFDLGCNMDLSKADGISSALVLKNFGNTINYFKTSEQLPSTVDLGFKIKSEDINNLTGVINVAQRVNDGTLIYSAGASIMPIYPLSVRAGFQYSADSLNSGLRGGLGLDFSNVTLNYSVEPFREFSMIQKISVDIGFGRIANSQTAYDFYLSKNFEIARDHYLRGDYIVARQMFEEILAMYPNHQPSKEYLSRIADNIDKLDQENKSITVKYLIKAKRAMIENNFIKAARYYDLVLGIDPANAQANEGKIEIEKMKQKLEEENNRRKNEARIVELWKSAMDYYNASDYVSAHEKVKELLALDPENSEARKYNKDIEDKLEKISGAQINEIYIKGLNLYNSKKYKEALKYFDSVLLVSPDRKDAATYKDLCLQKIGENESKEKNAKLSSENSKIKMKAEASYREGERFYKAGNYKEALRRFNDTAKIAEQNSLTVYLENSRAYILKTKAALAEKSLKSAQGFAEKGDLENSYNEYKKSLEQNPDNVTAKLELSKVSELLSKKYYEKGTNEFQNGDSEKAREYFNKSIYYKNNNLEAQSAIERLKHSKEGGKK